MHETLKNVCIFLVYLMTVCFLYALDPMLRKWFDFHKGELAKLLFLSVFYVIVFHVLYHYLGKQTHTAVYVITGIVFSLLLGLCKWGIVNLPG